KAERQPRTLDVAARQLRELHAEERAARLERDARREVFLDDEARRARGERVPLRAEEAGRARLRDCRERRGHVESLQPLTHAPAAADARRRGRARHLEDAED